MAQADTYRLQYEQWVRMYAPELYRYAYRLAGKRQTAEDLVQETFTEAWRCISKQKNPDQARGWLFQILRFRYAHFIRDNQRERQNVSLAEDVSEHPQDSFRPPLQTLADQDALQTALDVLSPPIRQTFLMVFLEERTCRETAELLHIPLGTVLSRLDGARRALRAVMAESRPSQRNAPASKPGNGK